MDLRRLGLLLPMALLSDSGGPVVFLHLDTCPHLDLADHFWLQHRIAIFSTTGHQEDISSVEKMKRGTIDRAIGPCRKIFAASFYNWKKEDRTSKCTELLLIYCGLDFTSFVTWTSLCQMKKCDKCSSSDVKVRGISKRKHFTSHHCLKGISK